MRRAPMRLTLVNQFYAPDISPTAQLAASLAEHRADLGDEVTVITGRAGYLEGLAPRRARPGPGAGPPRVDARPRQVVGRPPAARLRRLPGRRAPRAARRSRART